MILLAVPGTWLRPLGDLVCVTKQDDRAAACPIVADVEVGRQLKDLLGRLRRHFRRIEPFLKCRDYVLACASDLSKVNGWTVAEYIGDRSPDKVQRLLSKAAWDEDQVLGEIRRYVVEKLDAVAGDRSMRILAIDESGQEKTGSGTAGVKRQYMGCAGRVANGINTVYMTYARQRTGHALIGARQWIPKEQINNPAAASGMGLPEDLPFQTKGQIAASLVRDAHSDGISADFVTGDEVYGASPDLRRYCENSGQGYVLRVAKTFQVDLNKTSTRTCRHIVKTLLCRKRDWKIYSAGTGSKGARLYAWAWIGTRSPRHHVLIRRNIRTGECAYHYCYIPDGEPVTLRRLVTAAGLRWPVEECFEFAKDYFGLDHSQVRLYRAVKRHTTLVAATLAIFAVIAAQKQLATNTQPPPPATPDDIPPHDPGLIPLTIREIKKLFNAATRQTTAADLTAHWSRWRRRHQARARWYHQRTRLARNTTLAQVRP
jgi:SRSO17 transposase